VSIDVKGNKYNKFYIYGNLIMPFLIIKEKKKILFVWSYSSHWFNSSYFIVILIIFIKPVKLADILTKSVTIGPCFLLCPFLQQRFHLPCPSCLRFSNPSTDYWGRNQNHIERPKRRIPSPVGAMRSLGYIADSAVFSLFMWRNRIKTVATSWVPRWDYSRTVTPGNANPM